jgi:hypothetical protein
MQTPSIVTPYAYQYSWFIYKGLSISFRTLLVRNDILSIQGMHKRLVRFQKLIKNFQPTRAQHTCQQRELPIFLMCYQHFTAYREFRARFKKYIILVWCDFFKPCTKLTLHCNHRSERLKRSTQEAFSCCDAILETGPAAPQ